MQNKNRHKKRMKIQAHWQLYAFVLEHANFKCDKNNGHSITSRKWLLCKSKRMGEREEKKFDERNQEEKKKPFV